MGQCTVDKRREAKRARDAIEEHDLVVEPVSVVKPANDPLDAWTLDICVDTRGRKTVPRDVLALIHQLGCSVARLSPKGPDHHALVAVV